MKLLYIVIFVIITSLLFSCYCCLYDHNLDFLVYCHNTLFTIDFHHTQFQASPGNLSQFEEILFGANNELTVTTGVIGVKLASESGHRVCKRFIYFAVYCQNLL